MKLKFWSLPGSVLLFFLLLLNNGIRLELFSQLKSIYNLVNRKVIAGCLVFILPLAYFGGVVITWRDIGEYHWGLIKWLSQFGSVEGLVLIISGFAHTSAWYTIPAAFNFPPFEGRVGSLLGVFALLLLLLHFLISASRVFSNQSNVRRSDWFVCISTIIMMPIIVRWRIFISPSPDLPVILLGYLVPWTIIAIFEIKKEDNFENQKVIPFIMSLGACSFKFTAFPLLLGAYLYNLSGKSFSLKRVAGLGLLGFLFLSPVVFTNIKVSGCPLYPSSLMCIEGPSTMPKDKVDKIINVAIDWAHWEGASSEKYTLNKWVVIWMVRDKVAFLLVIATMFSFLLICKKYMLDNKKWVLWPLISGTIGCVFYLTLAPLLRFGLGYLVVLPSLWVALCSKSGFQVIRQLFTKTTQRSAFLSISLLLGFGLMTASIIWNNYSNFSKNIKLSVEQGVFPNQGVMEKLLIPAPIFNWKRSKVISGGNYRVTPVQYKRRMSNDVIYFSPVKKKGEYASCWDSELPCTRQGNVLNIRLKNPSKGLSGGFVKDGQG